MTPDTAPVEAPQRWYALRAGLRRNGYPFTARLVTAAVGLIQLLALVRFLSTDEYAAVVIAVNVGGYVLLLAEPAMYGYERLGNHVRALDSQPGDARSAATSLVLAVSCIIALGTFLWGLLTGNLSLAAGTALWLASLIQLRWVTVQWLNWGERHRFATVLVVNTVARTVLLTMAAYATGSAAVALAAGGLGSLLATTLVSPGLPPLTRSRTGLTRVLAVGLPISVTAAAGVSMITWPVLAASRTLSTDSFSAFSAQWTLAGATAGLTVGFVLAFGFPVVKRAWDSGQSTVAMAVTRRYIWYVIVCGLALTATFAATGEWVTALVLGLEYAGWAVPTATTATYAVSSLAGLTAWRLRLQFRQRSLSVIYVLWAAAQFALILWSSDTFGLPGILIGAALVQWGLTVTCALVSRERTAVLGLVGATILTGAAVITSLAA